MECAVIVVLLIILLLVWSSTLVFYKDRQTKPLETDESKCFAPRCHSIIKVHEDTPSDVAVFMIHGFPSTPHVYAYASERLFDAGFDTFAYLMPGFGTDPKDLKKTTYTQWFDFTCRKYEQLRQKYHTVFVLGISMGGFMAMHLSEVYHGSDKRPDAIVTVDAPIVYNSLKDHIVTRPVMYLVRILAIFKSTFATGCVNGIDSVDGNEDWTGYKGLFIHQGLSLIVAENKVRKKLSLIDVPMFSMHECHDKTVPFGNFMIISRENGSPDFRGRVVKMGSVNHNHHVLLMYRSVRVGLMDEILTFLEEKLHDKETK